MNFGERLYSFLCLKGMTQAELAKKTGMSPATISRYVKGKRCPSLDQVQLIADALGIKPSRFID